MIIETETSKTMDLNNLKKVYAELFFSTKIFNVLPKWQYVAFINKALIK